MPMLVWQAAAAQEIWSGHPFTAAQIAPVIEQANWEMERVFNEQTETDRNLVLCGFMGCGKSTVGRELAVQTGLSFLDMDHYIVEKAGLPVEEIFARHGEPYFRMLESQACKELAQTGGQIIATGGGALTFPQNAAMLRETGLIILLDVALPVLCARLDRDPTPRPVLQAAQKAVG